MEFTTRSGNLPEPPNSLSHTHDLTPYYENEERKGFTLDWTAPMDNVVNGDDVVGYRIVRYYQNLEPGPLGIGPQPPVTLVENTRSQDTEYTDVGPLANGKYTYLVWGPGRRWPPPGVLAVHRDGDRRLRPARQTGQRHCRGVSEPGRAGLG